MQITLLLLLEIFMSRVENVKMFTQRSRDDLRCIVVDYSKKCTSYHDFITSVNVFSVTDDKDFRKIVRCFTSFVRKFAQGLDTLLK